MGKHIVADWTWVSGASGSWFDAANWTPTGTPQAGDTATVLSGNPIIDGATITDETIRLGRGPVMLTAISATFEPGPLGILDLFVRGGDHENPADVTILSQGTTSFKGQLVVKALGGGRLSIDAESNGATANFVLDDPAFLLVSQESILDLRGEQITNNGVINVEGLARIAAGVELLGTGMIELEAGGRLVVAGSVAATQQVVFADGKSTLTIDDADLFQATIGLTQYGGSSIAFGDLLARSASVGDGVLTLYARPHHKGVVLAELSIELVNLADFAPLPTGEQTLGRRDFSIKGDGQGGTVVTYTPHGPTFLEASLPVPIVAATDTTVSLQTIFSQAFGTGDPGFYGITLLPATDQGPEGYWGQPAINGKHPLLSGWLVNGQPVTAPTVVTLDDDVKFRVGNNIGFPPQIQVQVTPNPGGGKAEYVTYDLWTLDPEVAQLIQASGLTPGDPAPNDIVAAANAYQAVYAKVLNSELCNWIADNVAAAAGATMPLPDALLDPSLNVEGGFWRIVYRGTDLTTPVEDWNTLVQPGDIVRLQWNNGTGHTTTVLAVNPDGTLEVYDNIDMNSAGDNTIGAHSEVSLLAADRPGRHHHLPPRPGESVSDQRHESRRAHSRQHLRQPCPRLWRRRYRQRFSRR